MKILFIRIIHTHIYFSIWLTNILKQILKKDDLIFIFKNLIIYETYYVLII